jgi:hypothetical protein
MLVRALGILFIAATLGQGGTEKRVDLSARAKDLVEKQVKDWKGDGYQVEVIKEKYLSDLFPEHTFVSVRFPLWPVARVPAEPLKSQNLFVVGDDRKVTHLPDSKKLEEFFKATTAKMPNEKKVVQAWLRLRMEYVQDGFYKFNYPDKIKEGPQASSVTILIGEVEVAPEGGNKGTFTATLRFNQKGMLASLSEENKVVQGMRPRVLGD